MTATGPLPPPPPPAPYAPAAPPPPPGAQPWWGQGPYRLPSRPRGEATRDAVDRIGRALRLYLLALLLSLLASAVSAAAVGGSIGGPLGSISPNQFAQTPANGSAPLHGPFGSGVSLAAAALSGVALLAVLILTIVAWVRWREAVQRLVDASPELGSNYVGAAQEAQRNYHRTVWTFLAEILISVGLAIALGVIIASALIPHFGSPAGAPSSSSVAATLRTDILDWTIAASVVGAALAGLLAYFATTSHRAALRPLLSAEGARSVDLGRTLAVVGALLSPVGVAGFFVPVLFPLAILSPVLVLVGYYLISREFARAVASGAGPGSGPSLLPS